MSGNDPKDTDSVETNETHEHAETSRRDLLTAGAAAAVLGVTAAVAAPKAAKAEGLGPGVWQLSGMEFVRTPDVSYLGDLMIVMGLSRIIKKVWDEMETDGKNGPIYKALMSIDPGTVRTQMNALIPGANDKISLDMPRVITMEMYNNGYVKRDVQEVVFVLPKPPGTANSSGKTGGSIRTLMAAVPFGM